MLTAILLVCAVALGWLLACGGLAPRSIAPAGGLDRRLRWVERHPGEVNTGDIERVLLRHGLSAADVRLVANRAFALGIKPFTMWMWIQAYGARELAVAVAGDLPHDELLEHLGEGTLPDFHELEMFASLNGLEAAMGGAEKARRGGLPAAVFETPEVERSRTLDDLEIYEPGTWPPGVRPQERTSDEKPAEPRRLPPGWDSFFDDLAA